MCVCFVKLYNHRNLEIHLCIRPGEWIWQNNVMVIKQINVIMYAAMYAALTISLPLFITSLIAVLV